MLGLDEYLAIRFLYQDPSLLSLAPQANPSLLGLALPLDPMIVGLDAQQAPAAMAPTEAGPTEGGLCFY